MRKHIPVILSRFGVWQDYFVPAHQTSLMGIQKVGSLYLNTVDWESKKPIGII